MSSALAALRDNTGHVLSYLTPFAVQLSRNAEYNHLRRAAQWAEALSRRRAHLQTFWNQAKLAVQQRAVRGYQSVINNLTRMNNRAVADKSPNETSEPKETPHAPPDNPLESQARPENYRGFVQGHKPVSALLPVDPELEKSSIPAVSASKRF